MKRFSAFFFLIVLVLCFVGCSENKPSVSAENLNMVVAGKLSEIENIESFDDESIKALSVIVRTNIASGKTAATKNIKNENVRLLNLVKQTENEKIYKNGKLAEVLIDGSAGEEWGVQIKKSDLLKYLSSKNISLANISKIEPIFDEENRFVSLDVGGKVICYEELKEAFGLKSNLITDIQNTSGAILIFGKDDAFNFCLPTKKISSLAKKGMGYREILSSELSGIEIM